MKEFTFYMLKSGIWIMIFWLIYHFFLCRETFFKFNRIFLLTGLLASLILPFCQYRYTVYLYPSFIESALPSASEFASTRFTFNWLTCFLIIYIIGSFFLFVYHLVGIIKIQHLIHEQKKNHKASLKIIEISENQASFSFFGYIFMDQSLEKSEIEKKLILEHEKAHIDQFHWFDLLISQLICIYQWWNPFVWFCMHAIKENHEFLADQSVLQNGNSPVIYHAALINYTLKSPIFTLSNSFSHYNKFKRINMMKKISSHPVKKIAVLLLLPAFAIFLWAFAEPEYVSKVEQSKVRKNEIKMINTIDDEMVSSSVEEDTTKIKVIGYEKEGGNSDTSFSKVIEQKVCQNKNEPLVIIDGKESSTNLKNIDSNDIESVSVLKGTAATNAYDIRGKNGVVIITTKKAKAGNPL